MNGTAPRREEEGIAGEYGAERAAVAVSSEC